MPDDIISQALAAAELTTKPRYPISEVAQILGIPLTTLRRLLREGNLQGSRFGKRWRWIYYQDLADFLTNSEKKSTSHEK